eukprot:3658993-Rhodomonas_salina.2
MGAYSHTHGSRPGTARNSDGTGSFTTLRNYFLRAQRPSLRLKRVHVYAAVKQDTTTLPRYLASLSG